MKRVILLFFAATRVGLVIVVLSAFVWLPTVTGPEYHHVSDNPLIDVWHRWDAAYFTGIAMRGYGWQAGYATGDATFMPFYPLFINLALRLLPHPTRADATVIGVILSNVCLLVSLFVFDALLALDIQDRRLRRLALGLFLAAPATVFFSAVYTESLFMLLSLTAIYAARREHWAIAGAAGFLAGLTRVMGWTVALPLIWEAWRQRERRTFSRWMHGMTAIAPTFALPLYAITVGITLGKLDAYFSITQQVWKQGWGWPWRTFAEFLVGPLSFWGWQGSVIDLSFTLVFLLLSISAFRLRPGYGLYSMAVVLFPVWSGTLLSMPRYVAVAFPAYIVLAQWAFRQRWRTVALLIGSALLAALFAARFVTWRWVA
jgi:Gpi18-like mannosyltransferase